jgi:hypothetical protein
MHIITNLYFIISLNFILKSIFTIDMHKILLHHIETFDTKNNYM